MSHVYISHSSDDLDALLEIHESLRMAAIPDWYAPNDKDDRAAADQAIDDAFAMIVLVSASSVRSKTVRADVTRAKARNLRLIPFQIDKARLNGFFKHEVQPHLRLSSTMPDGTRQLVAEVQAAYKRKCPVLAVMNLKGGVGKTTISSQVFGAWQSALGGRVLLVDLDPQYNLTQAFFDMEYADASAAADRSVISLFERSRLHARDVVSPGERWLSLSTEPFAAVPRAELVHDLMGEDSPGGRLDLISGQFEISKYAFASDAAALDKVKSQFLRMIDHYRSDYDLIVFDTNPNATFLTRCALEAADRVLAPMHPDIYSLRGVRLLNHVIEEQVEAGKRPALSVLFNAVGRSEQSTFEADARNGAYDAKAGFALSKALLKSALPRSGHLVVKAPKEGEPPWKQLLIHSGRGGGLKAIRESLKTIGMELKALVEA
ncbi:ParA family protein [Hyphomonas johnsonii]|uniref:Nucleotide binding protein n=1 Tax=Hyphomonas johnsonii MHS-2 TaxID=1280950 RepID=A0A059FUJ4_9PROT|nr:AAA family ATPase [Hyphomonas johnsonii]KCZ94176.1 nucleotide binding protein [Hyphomonas johnsonii MHS-2]